MATQNGVHKNGKWGFNLIIWEGQFTFSLKWSNMKMNWSVCGPKYGVEMWNA
jgi:hypothetical protein